MPQFEEFIKKLLDKAGRLVGDVLKQAALVFLQKHFDGWVKKQKAPLNELKWKMIEPAVEEFIEKFDSLDEIRDFAEENATVRAPRIAPRACAFDPAFCGMARVRWSRCARAACRAVS